MKITLRMVGLVLLAGLVVFGGPLDSAQAKDDVDPCVTFAKTWDSGVDEAKLLNVPMVVHSHGFK